MADLSVMPKRYWTCGGCARDGAVPWRSGSRYCADCIGALSPQPVPPPPCGFRAGDRVWLARVGPHMQYVVGGISALGLLTLYSADGQLLTGWYAPSDLHPVPLAGLDDGPPLPAPPPSLAVRAIDLGREM